MSKHPAIGIGQWMTARAQAAPQRPALTFQHTTWRYGDLLDRIDRFAGALKTAGVNPGDRVAFLAFNEPMYLVTLFACAKIGAIFVPLNSRLTGAELTYIIDNAGAHSIVAGPDHRNLVAQIRTQIACQRYWSFGGDDDEGWTPVEQAMATATPVHEPYASAADDVALLMFTSGTTGKPKGAMLTHGNLWWNAINEVFIKPDLLEDDVHLCVAPLFHIGGLNTGLLMTLMKGGHVVLHKTFDPERFLQDVPRYRVTTSFAVPAMLLFLSQHPAFAQADLSSLRTFTLGGAPAPEPLLRLYSERNIPVHQGYGLTETAPIVSFLAPQSALSKLGSAGKPPLFTKIRLVDAGGNVVTKPHVKGEICVHGPNVTKGYWNNPEATRAAIDDEGWFHTGDIGYFDEDGFYYVKDRVKDMIITGGENVYPAEVESVLYGHPAIAEVAVIGLPDEKWGEAVTAVVALKPGASLTLEALQVFASSKLARYKLPRRLHLVAALPRNTMGKVLKYQLRNTLG